LHNFMATDPDFKLKVRPSEALMRKSQEFLDQMQLALFPGTEEFGAPVNNSL
jgi:hypothetical protein